MEEKDWIKEFRQFKYEEIKQYIDRIARKRNYDYQFIKNLDKAYIEIEFPEFEEEYSSVWENLVDHMKNIHDGNVNLDYGVIIDNSGSTNNCAIPDGNRSAWQILKKCLLEKGIYSFEEMKELEGGTLEILKRMSLNTLNNEPVKGLVMGYVQSGKTTSMESLITMAADNGWNFVIVLSGIIENLRQQSLNRLRKDIEYNANAGNIHWKFSPGLDEDISSLINNGYKIVTVCLKNSKRLEHLKKWILNQSNVALQNMKILIIDDEADQASLNTLKIEREERTKINQHISELVNNKSFGAMNYIAYTATPYGNFLNEYGVESLYPTNFIHMLPKSSQYLGPKEIFGDEEADSDEFNEGLNIKNFISEEELKIIKEIEKGEEDALPESLKRAICWFLCTVAIQRYNKEIKPVSMLIHTTSKVNAHSLFSKVVEEWLEEQIRDVEDFIDECKEVYLEEVSNFNVNDFYKIMSKYRYDVKDYPKFEEIKDILREILLVHKPSSIPINEDGYLEYHKGIHLVIDNSSVKINDENEFVRLVYPTQENSVDFATAFIIVGGNTLSRGLTIEGLTTTYFARNVSQMDTLMQMGRWFGYRLGYELLPRIWLGDDSLNKFKELTNVENALREDLKKYENGLNPSEYGPIIQSAYNVKLSITSKNKMQSATTENISYVGAKAQETLYDVNKDKARNNIEVLEEFINKLEDVRPSNSIKSNLVSKGVDFKFINDNLLSKMQFCEHSSFFNNINAFSDWVLSNPNDNYKKWNIVFAGTAHGEPWNVKNHTINKVTRTRLKTIDDYFSIGALRNTKDILSDVDVFPSEFKSEKEVIRFREKIEESQIIIYRIDKNSRVNRNTENKYNRTDLNVEEDLVGIYIFVPGESYDKYIKSVTIKIPVKIDEEKDED